MPAIEGSYSATYAKGLSGFDHPDLPALKLAVAVLNAGESYLWKAVRGSGLAYGASVSANSGTGLTCYSVYRVCLGVISQLTAVTECQAGI
jgi:Zn-dependent M16 (insulinase) family peptidase